MAECLALTSCRRHSSELTYNNRRQKDKRTRKTMKTIGLFSGGLLFSVLCLLPEVIAECFASVSEDELCEKYIIKQLLNSVFA